MEQTVYTPGAGHLPRVLAGRGPLLQRITLLVDDVAVVGRPRARDLILVGPRGVGKTATLTTISQIAADRGYEVVALQAVAGRDGLVDSLLQRAASRIAQHAGPWTRARHMFDRIAEITLGVGGVNVGVGTHPPDRSSIRLDASTLAETLAELATEVRRDRPNGGVLFTLDEMQVGSAADLALLAATLHRLNVDFPQAAVMFAGTGLPHTPVVLAQAGVTHPDRLFLLEELPVSLSAEDAAYAIIEPARQADVGWHPDAVALVVDASNGYPAHLQLFADVTWRAAVGPTITVADATSALPIAYHEISRRTLGPRWEAMPDRQMEYLAAVAVLGGRTSSRLVATALGRSLQELSTVRNDLIREGDIYSPQRGHVALTMPTFRSFILDRYDQAQAVSEIAIVSLEDMRRHLDRDGTV